MWFDHLLDLIFPPACEVCGEPSAESLCPICFSRIKFMRPHMGVYAATRYEGVLRTAIHRYKFQKRKKLAGALGILLVRYLSEIQELDLKKIDAIIPVPLHRKRLRQRGFNQAEHLAQVVGRYYEVPVAGAIERVKDTHPNFNLSGADRWSNVSGAFRVVDSKSVYNKKLVLLDDIYTTGATAAECGKVLKTAGAARVDVLALARSVEQSA